MMSNERLEKRLEEVTYCLGKTLARLRVVEEQLKSMEQRSLQTAPQPATR
ncbi:hypothetical protein [Pseudobacillus wudalianchiensis]|nr:hypothetical protein [Bacillus wudalianchiensis]